MWASQTERRRSLPFSPEGFGSTFPKVEKKNKNLSEMKKGKKKKKLSNVEEEKKSAKVKCQNH